MMSRVNRPPPVILGHGFPIIRGLDLTGAKTAWRAAYRSPVHVLVRLDRIVSQSRPVGMNLGKPTVRSSRTTTRYQRFPSIRHSVSTPMLPRRATIVKGRVRTLRWPIVRSGARMTFGAWVSLSAAKF
jgi:hypothetical protein